MAKTRLEFQEFLEELKGDRNVYFQPPESFKMSYPAIRYNLENIQNVPADNIHYLKGVAYCLIYITDDPDDPMVETLSNLQMCKFDRWYASNNLNHFVFTIFY